jgi:Arc/MetJ-type ribon-helix-helix transcriptional regulator
MSENEIQSSYSSSARLSVADATAIDEFIELGYYNSRSAFVIDAIRDVSMSIVSDLAAMYPNLPEKATLLEIDQLLKSALHKKYILGSGYAYAPRKVLSIMVSINGKYTFLNYSIETIRDYLELKDLQSVITFVVYYKLKKVLKFMNETAAIKDYREKLTNAYLKKIPEDEAEELLRKAGLLNGTE